MNAGLAALAGAVGTVMGALLTFLSNRLTSAREDERRREERIWAERRAVYLRVLEWIGSVDGLVRDVFYSYTEYVEAEYVSDDEEWPTPLQVKRAEYRDLTPPDVWLDPPSLADVSAHLRAFAPTDAQNLARDAEFAAVRTIDEARSLGVYTIRNRQRSSSEVEVANRVIGGYYERWLLSSNQLENLIRRYFDPTLDLVPLDSRVQG